MFLVVIICITIPPEKLSSGYTYITRSDDGHALLKHNARIRCILIFADVFPLIIATFVLVLSGVRSGAGYSIYSKH